MWTRISNLNLLSNPQFYIGLYLHPVPNHAMEQLKTWVPDRLGKLRKGVWWCNGDLHKQPEYRVLKEDAVCQRCYIRQIGPMLDTGVYQLTVQPEYLQWYFGVTSFRDVLI
jgi:hypothetical protein